MGSNKCTKFRGVSYPSRRQACAEHDAIYDAVLYRMKSRSCSFEEALELVIAEPSSSLDYSATVVIDEMVMSVEEALLFKGIDKRAVWVAVKGKGLSVPDAFLYAYFATLPPKECTLSSGPVLDALKSNSRWRSNTCTWLKYKTQFESLGCPIAIATKHGNKHNLTPEEELYYRERLLPDIGKEIKGLHVTTATMYKQRNKRKMHISELINIMKTNPSIPLDEKWFNRSCFWGVYSSFTSRDGIKYYKLKCPMCGKFVWLKAEEVPIFECEVGGQR